MRKHIGELTGTTLVAFAVFIIVGIILIRTTPREAYVKTTAIYPTKEGCLNDYADILSRDEELLLNGECRLIGAAQPVQVAIAILDRDTLGNQSPDDYGQALGDRWNIGKKTGSGILLVIVPKIGLREGGAVIYVAGDARSAFSKEWMAGVANDLNQKITRGDSIASVTAAGMKAVVEALRPLGLKDDPQEDNQIQSPGRASSMRAARTICYAAEGANGPMPSFLIAPPPLSPLQTRSRSPQAASGSP